MSARWLRWEDSALARATGYADACERLSHRKPEIVMWRARRAHLVWATPPPVSPRWTPEEDHIALTVRPCALAAAMTGRSEKAITVRASTLRRRANR